MNLLLHTCCAPCLIYPLERLTERGFAVAGLFYNPNIHPYSEYLKRREAVEGFSKALEIKVEFPEYRPDEFFRKVHLTEASPGRCSLCWLLRLKVTAQAAKRNGFDGFSTTLLVSPYQDQGLLHKIGEDIAREEGIDFYYEDFRPGFRKAHNTAKEKGIYCQRYCGCIYSEIERDK